MTRANRQTNTYRNEYKNEIQNDYKSFKYGRCINFSYGLIFGLIIDKGLFFLSKGLSVFFPPFAMFLMGKGKVLFTLRFDKTFNGLFEKVLSHIITK